jgi:hypothetical protein
VISINHASNDQVEIQCEGRYLAFATFIEGKAINGKCRIENTIVYCGLVSGDSRVAKP